MTVRRVRVGDVLRLERTRITPDPKQTYRQIGIYSWGKGVIENDPISGAELSKVTYYHFPPAALLLSNIQAWEAAIATSSAEQAHRFIASQRFLPYVPIKKHEVDTRYLLHFFLSDAGMALIRKASPGTVTRNRTLGIAAFENLLIPLPGLPEQRAIALRLAALDDARQEMAASNPRAAVGLFDRHEADVIQRRMAVSRIALADLAEINPRQDLRTSGPVHFVPMADVDEQTGEIIGTQIVEKADLGAGYKRFSTGDIIFARITPCMQNGKIALFRGRLSPVGLGSTEFHVIRPRRGENAEALHALLRTRWFRELAKERFTGTAGQQRVPASFLNEVYLPDISGVEGNQLAAQLAKVDRNRRALIKLHKQRAALLDALPQASRNEVFSKLG